MIINNQNYKNLNTYVNKIKDYNIIFLGHCIFYQNSNTLFNIGNIIMNKDIKNSVFIKGKVLTIRPDKKIEYIKDIIIAPNSFIFIELLNGFCFELREGGSCYYFKIHWDLIPKDYPYFKEMKIYHHFEWCLQFKEKVKKMKVFELYKIMSSANVLIFILDYKFKHLVHQYFKGSIMEHSLKNYDDTFCNIDSTNPNVKLILKWEKYVGYPFPKFNYLYLRDVSNGVCNLEGKKIKITKKAKFILSLINTEKSTAYIIKHSLQIYKEWNKVKFKLDNIKDYVGLAVHYRNKKFLLVNTSNDNIVFINTTDSIVKNITIYDYVKKILKKR